MTATLKNNASTLAIGLPATLDDLYLAYDLSADTTYYLSITMKDGLAVPYPNYTIQFGINCNLTLSACSPDKVDAVNCVCTNRTSPISTTTASTVSIKQCPQ